MYSRCNPTTDPGNSNKPSTSTRRTIFLNESLGEAEPFDWEEVDGGEEVEEVGETQWSVERGHRVTREASGRKGTLPDTTVDQDKTLLDEVSLAGVWKVQTRFVDT